MFSAVLLQSMFENENLCYSEEGFYLYFWYLIYQFVYMQFTLELPACQ